MAEYLLSELQHLILSFRAVPRELGENMLWTTCAILVILWLLGWGLHLAGTAVHLLLVLALIIFILDLVTGHRTVFVRTGEGLRPLARLARLLQVPKEKQSELRKFPRFPAQLSLAVTVDRAGKLAMLQGVSTDLGEGGIWRHSRWRPRTMRVCTAYDFRFATGDTTRTACSGSLSQR